MAKKRKNPFEDPFRNDGFSAMDDDMGLPEVPGLDLSTLAPLVSGMTDHDGLVLFSMIGHMVEMGVTPEKYTSFYNAFQKLRPLFAPLESSGKGKVSKRTVSSSKETNLKDKTLLLKIQMKGVSKPPMWREVEVPADMTFLDLHDVIQCVVGLENSHLWQFNERAYDNWLLIGIQSGGGFDFGLEYVTDDAEVTPISAYLGEVGAKLEYVYDFGDDWVFAVTVKKILDKKTEHPVCTAFKSKLNAIEDTGGPWSYEEQRKNLEDWKKLKKKEKEEIAYHACFDTPEDYYDMLQDSLFDLDAVNERLKTF